MLRDPVDQGGVEPDIPARLFRLDPLVPEDLLTFRKELPVKATEAQIQNGQPVGLWVKYKVNFSMK